MAGSWPPDNFPDLKSPDYKVTSPATRRYNCLAWAAGETGRRWEPDPLGIYYWPPRVPRVRTTTSGSDLGNKSSHQAIQLSRLGRWGNRSQVGTRSAGNILLASKGSAGSHDGGGGCCLRIAGLLSL